MKREARGVMELIMNVMRMLPSQKEPMVDLGGLWYAGEKGVMLVEIVR